MKKKLGKVSIVKFEYISDWYHTPDVEVDTDEFDYFVFENRECGKICFWYLCHYKIVDGKSIHEYHNDFNLYRPADALRKLMPKVRKFRCMHATDGFAEGLAFLLNKAKIEPITK